MFINAFSNNLIVEERGDLKGMTLVSFFLFSFFLSFFLLSFFSCSQHSLVNIFLIHIWETPKLLTHFEVQKKLQEEPKFCHLSPVICHKTCQQCQQSKPQTLPLLTRKGCSPRQKYLSWGDSLIT